MLLDNKSDILKSDDIEYVVEKEIKSENESNLDDIPKAITEPEQSAEQKKKDHETAEAKRKAEWEVRTAGRKAAEDKTLDEIRSMSDNDIADASVKKLGVDVERLTRRNMKVCVGEHVQILCSENLEFARKVMYPKKNMVNCFKYINKKAQEYLKQEMEENDEKSAGGYTMGGDVPDDLCYMWAEEYFNDSNAEIDKEKDEKFVPKPYYGGSSSSKTNKKDPSKSKPKETVAEKETETDIEQIDLFGGDEV